MGGPRFRRDDPGKGVFSMFGRRFGRRHPALDQRNSLVAAAAFTINPHGVRYARMRLRRLRLSK